MTLATMTSLPDLWEKVHEELQVQLVLLEDEVRHKMPEIRVRTGRTSGENFLLFSYRTFSMPDTGLDPVVVGMTFTSVDQGVKVEADISGEQTGDLISPVRSKTVADSREALLAAARDSARDLCKSADAVAAALANPSRRVE